MRNDTTGQCAAPPCPEGQMRNETTGTCAPPPCEAGGMPSGESCGPPSNTSTTAPIPFFPTTASLVLASLGAIGGSLILLGRRTRR